LVGISNNQYRAPFLNAVYFRDEENEGGSTLQQRQITMISRCANFLPHTNLPFQLLLFIIPVLFFTGCGTTKSKTGTDQLLMSNAVDLTVGDLDFSAVAGEKVFLDTQFINIKGYGFVNSQYIVSSLRQQLIAHGCQLLDSKSESDFIIEARVGALGTDSQTITYGIPGNNAIGNMASLLPNVPAVPVIPEISIAKRDDTTGIAKISVFIYETKTKMPIWQSGIEYARSTSNDMWIFGAGPLQWGTVHGQTKFAGTPVNFDKINVAKWLRPKEEPLDAEHAIYFNKFKFGNTSSSLVLPAAYIPDGGSADEPEEEVKDPDEPAVFNPNPAARQIPQ
jgi:hypothetical protein